MERCFHSFDGYETAEKTVRNVLPDRGGKVDRAVYMDRWMELNYDSEGSDVFALTVHALSLSLTGFTKPVPGEARDVVDYWTTGCQNEKNCFHRRKARLQTNNH